jgi:putative endonuclease
MSKAKQSLGRLGESLAAENMQKQGYRIVIRNFRTKEGEIDLIVTKGDLLVIVEVKSRSSTLFGEGFEAVTLTKQKRLKRLAAAYLKECSILYRIVRFDVISILIGPSGKLLNLKHFEEAF